MKFAHNISRIEAFSDAVFAFAATLLVVSLGVENSDSIIEVDFKSFISFGLPGIIYSLLGPFCALYSYLFFKKNKIS